MCVVLPTVRNDFPRGFWWLMLLWRMRLGDRVSQQAFAQPSRESGVVLLASVIVEEGWHLVGPGLYSPAIVGVVCIAVAMMEKGRPGTRSLGPAGLRLVGYATGVSRTIVEWSGIPGMFLWLCLDGAARAGKGTKAERSKKL